MGYVWGGRYTLQLCHYIILMPCLGSIVLLSNLLSNLLPNLLPNLLSNLPPNYLSNLLPNLLSNLTKTGANSTR